VESFTRQILKDILPTIAIPDPFLTLLGTLSILYHRIHSKNLIISMNKIGWLPIKLEDKYFDQKVLEQILEVLNLPSERVEDEDTFGRLTTLVKLSFSELMNNYLEHHQYPVSAAYITMK
jgi:hypothetical protein